MQWNRILQAFLTLYFIYFEKNKIDLKKIVKFSFKKVVSKMVTFEFYIDKLLKSKFVKF